MSDEQFPGFIDDEPKPPAKPAKPAAPAPAFDPFAAPPAAPGAKAPLRPAAKPSVKAAPAKAPPAAGAAFDPFAGVAVDPKAAAAAAKPTAASQAAAADAEADIKPGMAKDLWSCPHCGTKNKPTRDTCRQCSKLPSDEVVVPWHQPLGVRLGIAGGALAVIVLLGWLLLGGSVALVPADVDHLDRKPRLGGSPGAEVQLDGGQTFVPKQKFAVCGRVLLVNPAVNGLTSVVLALGEDGKAEDVATTTTVDLSGSDVTTTPERRVTVINAFGNLPAFTKGAIVSVLGDVGTLQGETNPPFGDIVRIDQAQ